MNGKERRATEERTVTEKEEQLDTPAARRFLLYKLYFTVLCTVRYCKMCIQHIAENSKYQVKYSVTSLL